MRTDQLIETLLSGKIIETFSAGDSKRYKIEDGYLMYSYGSSKTFNRNCSSAYLSAEHAFKVYEEPKTVTVSEDELKQLKDHITELEQGAS